MSRDGDEKVITEWKRLWEARERPEGMGAG